MLQSGRAPISVARLAASNRMAVVNREAVIAGGGGAVLVDVQLRELDASGVSTLQLLKDRLDGPHGPPPDNGAQKSSTTTDARVSDGGRRARTASGDLEH